MQSNAKGHGQDRLVELRSTAPLRSIKPYGNSMLARTPRIWTLLNPKSHPGPLEFRRANCGVHGSLFVLPIVKGRVSEFDWVGDLSWVFYLEGLVF